MKINVKGIVQDYKGSPVKLGGGKEDAEDMTWRDVMFQALNTLTDKDQNMSADQKLKLYSLTRKIFDNDSPDIEVEEATLILERIAMIFPPLMYGRAKELFKAPEDNEKKSTPEA